MILKSLRFGQRLALEVSRLPSILFGLPHEKRDLLYIPNDGPEGWRSQREAAFIAGRLRKYFGFTILRVS